jgi:peptide/nickel transport system permease protein
MGRYVLGRLGQGLVVLWGVTLIVFLLIHFVPGDPGRAVLGTKASPAAVARLDHRLGLDNSIVTQYGDYVSGLAHGDLGTSITEFASVTSLIGSRLVPTLALVAYAVAVAIAIAIPLALIAALRVNRLPDHLVRLIAVVLYAIPAFWFGLMLAVLFGLKWHIFPTSGYNGSFPLGLLRTLTLPAVTIALFVAPVIVRVLRSSLIESLGSDFAQAARARGIGSRRVLVRHVLRSSLTATVTLLGVSIGQLVGLIVVVEQVFAFPGLGSLLVSSVLSRDYPTVQGVTLLFALLVVVANLMADLMYAVLDPRVRL